MLRTPPVLLNRNPLGFRAAIRKWHAHPRALVEGDSWFQYDAVIAVNPTPANLFLSTCEYFRCVSLSLAQVGDTVSHMLGPTPAFGKPGMPIEDDPSGARNLGRIADYLKPENRIDVLFFSGGGNDVVDNLANLIRPFEANITAKDALIEERVDVQMEALRRGYRRLLDVRDRVSPHTWLMTHQYGVPNLHKGGFLIVDDFKPEGWRGVPGGGWEPFAAAMRRVLPDLKFFEMSPDDPIFHSFFEIPQGLLADFPQAYNYGRPVFRGIYEDNDPRKRLIAIVNYNTDVSQYWEWSGRGFRPFNDTNEAYKLGVNYLIYGLTH